VDPLSFLAGPVEVVYGGDAADTRVADLSKLIDRSAKVVRSVTGELALDYGRRVATLAAPQAQGVCGFLKGAGGRFDLGAVTVESGNDYAAVLAVSLDGRPLAESGKVLIQVGTRSRPTGWQDRPETLEVKGQPPAPGLEILNIGTAPWMVENTEGAVAVKNSTLTRATLLDANFNAAADVPVRRDGGALRLTLPPHAMYVVLQ
jgi:hypothetical protein